MKRRVLVSGGTGGFGARLVEGLVATTDLDVVIAARGAQRAEALAAMLRAKYPDRPIDVHTFDAAEADADDLRHLRIWCVADIAGPFQTASTRLVRAAIAAGSHYVDVADAGDFIAGIARFDADARAANVLAVTGASSTPALTNAVLDHMTEGWRRIDRVDIALSPGNRQPRGLSIVKTLLANAGRPFRVFRNGAWESVAGMSMLVRRRIPGLGRRWLFVVNTPDLELVPQRFAPRRDAVFRAGLELPILHLGLWAMSKLVASGLLPSLVPLARPLRAISEWFRTFGAGLGGMTVCAEGLDREGRAVTATWTLLAAEDGPNVPILPALALIRALARDGISKRGAMACVGLLSLADISREFERFRIVIRRSLTPRALFARVLGDAFDSLPDAIQQGHAIDDRLVLEGRASVAGGRSRAARWAARLIGFPTDTPDIAVRVEMRTVGNGEVWRRSFGRARFHSQLFPCAGRRGRVRERFGLCTFELKLSAGPQGLDYAITSGRFGFIPLPAILLPRSFAKERVDGAGRFYFDVPIALPGIGLLVHYRGWLAPSASSSQAGV